jgi:hypothetical protein
MQWSEKEKVFDEVVEMLAKLQKTKGGEYSSPVDCLQNFKNGEEIGVRPIQKNFIFLDKHYSSIKSYIKLGKELSDEPIEGRILDAMNYLFLMYCLIKEEKDTIKQGNGVS